MLANSMAAGNKITAKMIRDDIEEYLKTLDEKYKALVDEITAEFEGLGELTKAAFETQNNLKALSLSVELAYAYGVEESSILKSSADVDRYMK